MINQCGELNRWDNLRLGLMETHSSHASTTLVLIIRNYGEGILKFLSPRNKGQCYELGEATQRKEETLLVSFQSEENRSWGEVY